MNNNNINNNNNIACESHNELRDLEAEMLKVVCNDFKILIGPLEVCAAMLERLTLYAKSSVEHHR